METIGRDLLYTTWNDQSSRKTVAVVERPHSNCRQIRDIRQIQTCQTTTLESKFANSLNCCRQCHLSQCACGLKGTGFDFLGVSWERHICQKVAITETPFTDCFQTSWKMECLQGRTKCKCIRTKNL